MIGRATLTPPATTTASPHAAPHEPNAAATTPEPAHDARRPAHEGDASDARPRADRTHAEAERASHAQGSRAARATRRGRGERAERDDAPAHDAFARLLHPAPAPTEAKPPLPTPAAAPTQGADATAADAKPASLPDQLLGLLASLAPGAQAAPANAAPMPATATDAPPPAAIAASPQGKPTTPAVGPDAAGALLPALQGTPRASDADAATATAALAAAVKSDETASTPPSLRDTPRQDGTPTPTPFDALLRTPGATAADVPRPIVPTTPAAVAQPANPDAGYGDELGTSVVWMAEQRIGHADVRVVPDHLGPIDVRLQLDGTQVHATFLSAQPDVRHALEASLPRLRDLLGQHGLELAQADVGQRQQDPRATRQEGRAMADGRDAAGRDDVASASSTRPSRVVRGLLDEYA